MTVKCEIILQTAKDGVFRPGESVIGTVKYFIDVPMKLKTIDISFIGKGTCQWSRAGPDKRSIVYKPEEEYVNVKKNLFKARVDQEVRQSGTFKYPFEFLLPDDVPSSIKTNTGGKIEYKVTVIFVRLKGNIHEFIKEIPVYGYVRPCSPEPLIFGLHKYIFSLTLVKKVDIKGEIERALLTPGENIKLKLAINNDTDFPIAIQTELIEHVTYVSDYGERSVASTPVITTKTNSTTMAEQSLSVITCVVPTLTSLYSIQSAKVLIRGYRVRVTATFPSPHINAVVEVPVVIGERRGHLGAAVIDYDDGNPSSSKTPDEGAGNLIKL